MPDPTKGATIHYPSTGMQGGMSEVLRLMREGKLSEATARIQDNLGNPMSNPVGNSVGNPNVTETPFAKGYKTPGGDKTTPLSRLITLPGTASESRPKMRANPTGATRSRARVRTPRPSPDTSTTSGRFVTGSFTNKAGTRAYKLYVPSGVSGGVSDGVAAELLPLVVMLHGCTQNADDFAAGTGMNALAESGGFLVVYPEQSSGANPSRCWNWFKGDDQRRELGEPSIIAGITRQVSATYPVDEGRVYVAGMSAGGAMAVIMAETYPDLYAAVGVHSGLAYGAARDFPSAFRAMKQGAPDPTRTKTPAAGAVDFTRTVPAIVFHGDRDGTVHRRNGDQILNQYATPKTIPDRAGVPPVKVRQGQATGGRSYTRSVYQDETGDSIAEGWLIHGAGHAWSGGKPAGSYTDSSGPDASAEMVRFFLEHPQS